MDAVSTSMVILLLIFGLGLSGASYSQCKDTLSSNGYNFTDSQYQSFYEAANDPDNINYINTHSDSLSNDWTLVSSGDTSLSEWYDNYVIEASGNTSGSSLSPVDSLWVEGGESQSVTVWDDDLREDAYLKLYGTHGKTVSDGHGGYYYSYIDNSSSSSTSVGTYFVYHYDSDGNSKRLFQGDVPVLSGPDVVYGTVSIYYDFYIVENENGSQTCYTTQAKTVNNAKLEQVNYLNTYDSTLNFSDERTSEIEEQKGDPIELVVNPDGSITLPDGSLVYPNPDGTYTIGGTDYAPSKSIPDINDLLDQLLDLQQQLDELKKLQFDKDTTSSFDVSQSVEDAVGAYDGDLSEFLLNSRITQVFPFCLPFDFVRGLKLFSTSPVAPKFDINFDIPSFGAYPGTHNVISLDLGVYTKYFTVVRWSTTIIFIISLTLITSKLIKW